MPGEIRKVVTFSSDREQHLWELAQSIPNFSGWVKEQLRRLAEQRSSAKEDHSLKGSVNVMEDK